MKSIQKELADIQKTIQKFSKLLDQIEKSVDGTGTEKTALKKGRKKKKAAAKQQGEPQVVAPTAETAAESPVE